MDLERRRREAESGAPLSGVGRFLRRHVVEGSLKQLQRFFFLMAFGEDVRLLEVVLATGPLLLGRLKRERCVRQREGSRVDGRDELCTQGETSDGRGVKQADK